LGLLAKSKAALAPSFPSSAITRSRDLREETMDISVKEKTALAKINKEIINISESKFKAPLLQI
jgi:hypothetical protein